ncbi:hypothetical protein YC2023_035989 [Brassica napus]
MYDTFCFVASTRYFVCFPRNFFQNQKDKSNIAFDPSLSLLHLVGVRIDTSDHML